MTTDLRSVRTFVSVFLWALLALPALAAPETKPIVDGMFDVGGHRLFLHCAGSGAPTVVYFHGYNDKLDGSGANAGSAVSLPWRVSPDYRFCAYSRANDGKSDKVEGPITIEAAVEDAHRLLEAGGIKPPFVLLGASFGGLIAYDFAHAYPDEVKAMLLLDASFPDEITLEHFFAPADRLTHDWWKIDHSENIDQLEAYEATYKLRAHELKIPVTYLLASQTQWKDGPSDDYTDAAIAAARAYVADFSPGIVIDVVSKHWMESAVPERIVEELKRLIASLPPG